jgi:hypothetical protein
MIVQMDYERRMQLDWAELWDPKRDMETHSSDLGARIVQFLGGKAPLKAWKNGQRWMSLAATGCWVLAAIEIGANAAALPAIHERFVTAWDIVVAQSGEPSGDSDHKEEPSTTSASNNPVRPLPDDRERINRLSRAFERAATQSRPFWKQPQQEPAYQQREVREFILRSALAPRIFRPRTRQDQPTRM